MCFPDLFTNDDGNGETFLRLIPNFRSSQGKFGAMYNVHTLYINSHDALC
jgi:hypothetical protein